MRTTMGAAGGAVGDAILPGRTDAVEWDSCAPNETTA